jgi:hypothetical protein
VLLVLLLVLVGLAVTGDRVAVSVAQNKIADRLQDEHPFVGRPVVTIHGFPFITQAVGGKYDDIEIESDGDPVGKLGSIHIDARMHGVHLTLSDATRHVDQVPVDRAELTLSVSLTALANASGIDGLTLTSNGDTITARAPVGLPGLGTVPVSASGRLNINSSGGIGVDLSSLQAAGAALPEALQDAARTALSFIIDIDGLPFKSAATSVRVASDRVFLSATANDIVLQ